MNKEGQIIATVELPIKQAFAAYAKHQGMSESRLARSIIIDVLLQRGLIPDNMLERLVV